jgi:hypothetical protein
MLPIKPKICLRTAELRSELDEKRDEVQLPGRPERRARWSQSAYPLRAAAVEKDAIVSVYPPPPSFPNGVTGQSPERNSSAL